MEQNKSSLDENNKLNVFIGNCRVCMSKSDPVKSLFHPDSNFIEEIEFCTGILLTQNDNLPSSICLNCEEKLTVACKFKKTCISSEDSFRRLLEDLSMTKVKCEESKSEEPCLKVEHISDDENDDGDYFKSEETYLKVEYNCDDENDDGDYFKSKEPCLKVEYNCDDENDHGDYLKSEEPCPKLEYNYGDENDDGDSFVEGPKDTEVVIEVPVINYKKERQKRYREQNRDKLKQREAERRKRIQYLQSIGGPSTSSNTNRIEWNNEGIAAISQSSSGLEKTQPSSIQRNEQGIQMNARQKKREHQRRYREQNRDKLKQREAERRRRLQNAKMKTDLSTSPKYMI